MPKTAIEKLNAKKEPKIVKKLPENIPWAPPHSSMAVSTPAEVNAMMRTIPAGRITTITEIREALALRYKTTIACPVSTGIFINIAAHAAEEYLSQGKQNITPYWRVLKADGFLNEKYPGGIEHHKKLLEAENFIVVSKGKRFFVQDYTQFLYCFTTE